MGLKCCSQNLRTCYNTLYFLSILFTYIHTYRQERKTNMYIRTMSHNLYPSLASSGGVARLNLQKKKLKKNFNPLKFIDKLIHKAKLNAQILYNLGGIRRLPVFFEGYVTIHVLYERGLECGLNCDM